MRIRRKAKLKISRERLCRIILNTEPSLTLDMVTRYTDSELREWIKLLELNVTLV